MFCFNWELNILKHISLVSNDIRELEMNIKDINKVYAHLVTIWWVDSKAYTVYTVVKAW